MLDFIEEKISEAIQHPNSAKAALEEASGAIAPMKDRLRKEESDRNSSLMMALGMFHIFDANMKRMDADELNDFIEQLQVARGVVAYFIQ